MPSNENPSITTSSTGFSGTRENYLKAIFLKYKLLSDASLDGIAIHDDGTLIYTNHTLWSMFGYHRNEIRGLDIRDLVSTSFRQQLSMALKDQQEGFFETIAQRKDGSTFMVELHFTQFKEDTGEKFRAIIVRDISKRKAVEKRLLQSEAAFKKLFEDSKDAIYISNKDGTVQAFNQAGLELLGYTRHEIYNLNTRDLYANPNDRASFIKEIEKYGAIRDYEVRLRKKTGEIIDCLLTSSIRRDNDGIIIGYQGIMRDITDLKMANELKKAKELAEKSAELKSRFLANMSHEIRTPLNAIFGITNLLEDTTLTEQQRHYLDVIGSSTDHLLVLVNDILDFSKIEAGKLQLEPVEFSLLDLLENLQSSAQYRVSQKGLEFNIVRSDHVPEFLIGDLVRLKQILLNLLSNAIKFTEEGRVELIVKVLEEKETFVKLYFAVKDTGIGIEKEKQGIIFDSFTQADTNTTRIFGGTGLGLAITKRLVEMQGGTISLKSELGMGSTFLFTLTFKKSSGENYLQRKADATPKEIHDLGDLRILMVEDNKVNQFVTSETIYKWGTGLKIDLADDGKQALDLLENNDYDLIIMDVQMPIMDGHTATRIIRKDFPEPKRSIPILAMTAFATAGEAEKCMEAGMDDYIPKPFNPKNLYNKIAELTGRKEGKVIGKMEPVQKSTTKGDSDPIINLKYLDTITQGDTELRKKMIQVIIDESPSDIERLKKLLEEKKWESFAAAAHKFKSSATFMGNKGLEKELKIMELNARNSKDLEKLPDQLDQVESIFDRAIKLLRQELQ